MYTVKFDQLVGRSFPDFTVELSLAGLESALIAPTHRADSRWHMQESKES
jgi:hypothetical protein